MHNGVILTQQQYFMMVHNYVSERNMDIDRISHRIDNTQYPRFHTYYTFIEDDGEHNVGGKPRRKRDAKRFQTDANQNRFVATAPLKNEGLNRSLNRGLNDNPAETSALRRHVIPTLIHVVMFPRFVNTRGRNTTDTH
jgi:hypothetical protein